MYDVHVFCIKYVILCITCTTCFPEIEIDLHKLINFPMDIFIVLHLLVILSLSVCISVPISS